MKVQRYNLLGEDEDGLWVKYEDYQQLEARIAELEKQLAEAISLFKNLNINSISSY